ncbi:relaxase/mobilization nuclease domain-containing protein [Polaribacter sp.]|uniref:relaxase/mobilization nuclease domain-containing protein n=1 Tax=Polaribacter sp. TaxID=1920175 RepID=UPI003F6AF22F
MQKLIRYVFAPKKLIDHKLNRNQLIIKRNIRGYDPEKWADLFQQNDKSRIFEHKNRTVLRHEIVSFSPEDNSKITRETLQDIAKWYLKHRSDSMGVCGVHWEESIHLHFIISGVGMDGKSTRISRQDFKDFKIKLQDYQQERYPELSKSIVNHSKKKKWR